MCVSCTMYVACIWDDCIAGSTHSGSWRISWWILTIWDGCWIMMNLLMDLDKMRYLMNHEESPDGSWQNEISDESWRISWWILTKWDIWWIMKNLLMDLDEMRYLMNHEESPDESWRNETAAASWRISWWTLDGCGSPSVAMPTLAKTMCTKEA